MKSKNIAITNLTGARNRGVEALVHSTMAGVSKELEGTEINWSVHTNDPTYDEWRYSNFGADAYLSYLTNSPNHFKSKVMNKALYKSLALAEKVMPDKLKLLKSQTDLKKADLVICSGGDIFTSDYGNLRKHMSYPIVAGKKTFLCSHTIGPFNSADEKYFKKCLDQVSAITVREKLSYDYLKSIVSNGTIVEEVADVAFSLPYSKNEGLRIVQEELNLESQNIVALSISKGIVRYSGISEQEYVHHVVQFCDHLIGIGYDLIFVPHVMERNINNNDSIICLEVMRKVSHPKKCRIMSCEYSASEFKSVIGNCSALVGARTHATIASMSQCIPTVSIAYSRKAYGIVNDVYGEGYKDHIVDSKVLTSKNLISAFENSLERPISSSNVEALKNKSKNNFSVAKKVLNDY